MIEYLLTQILLLRVIQKDHLSKQMASCLGKQMAKRIIKIHQDTPKIFMFWYQETLYELFTLLERKSL